MAGVLKIYTGSDFVEVPSGTSGVQSIVAGSNVTVDNSDPKNPVVSASSSGGSGDVVGPASAVNNNFAAFDTTTGKLIKDSGSKASDFASAYHAHQAGIEGLPTIADGTAGNAGKVQIASGVAWFYTDATLETLIQVTIAASAYLSPADDVTNYLCADRDTGTWVILNSGTSPTSADYVRYLPYVIIFKRTGSTSLHKQIIALEAHGEVESHSQRILATERYARETGALISLACADTTTAITLAGGGVWSVNHRYSIPAVTTATRQFDCLNTSGTWSYASHTAPVLVSTTQYNGTAGLVTMTNGYYAICYVYRGIEDEDHIYTFLSDAEYASLDLAKAANLLPTIPPLADAHAMFVGRIIYQKSQTTGFVAQSAFDTVFSASTAVTAHNSLTGLNVGDYLHLSATQKTDLTGAASADAQHYHGKTVYLVRNETGVSIAALRAVYVTGFNNVPLVGLADNTNISKHHPIGVTTAAIADQTNGAIVTNGLLTNVDTNAWPVGTKLWLSTAGQLTNTEPTSGEIIFMGEVVVQQVNGSILLYPDRGTDFVAAASGQDIHVRMGDSAGANVVRFEDYTDTLVASINSDGAASFASATVGGQAVVVTTDSRLSDARTPTAHTQAESTITFTDITTGNATTGQHGYLPKLGGGTSNFLRADGTWAAPAGGPGGGGDGGFSFKYAFDTGTAGNPTTGEIQMDNATPSAATTLYIYETDGTGVAIDNFLDFVNPLDMVMLSNADRSVFHVFTVPSTFVSGASIDSLPVTWSCGTGAGATNFSNAETIYLSVLHADHDDAQGIIMPMARGYFL